MEKAFQFPKLQEQFQERGIGARPRCSLPRWISTNVGLY